MSDKLYSKTLLLGAGSVTAVLWSVPAFAYLDPGTGSMLIQGIIGAIAALGVTLKLYWYKIRQIFRVRRPQDKKKRRTETGQ